MSDCKNGLFNCITPLPMDASGKMSDYEFLCWVNQQLNQIKAWIAQNVPCNKEGVVTPQMFGAKGDGITDDTEAIQKAINTGKNVYFPVMNGEIYLVSGQLRVTKPHQCFIGTIWENVWDDVVTKEMGVGAIYYTGYSDLFTVTTYGVRFQGLTFVGENYVVSTQEVGTAITIDATTEQDNSDALISGCMFHNWAYCIINYGRGIGIKNCAFFQYNTAIVQNYTFDGSGALDVQQPDYGDRAVRIINNRFHTGNTCFVNQSGILYGFIMSSNVSDGTARLAMLYGGMRNSSIINNMVPLCNREACITFFTGPFICNVISNNTISGLDTWTSNNRIIWVRTGVEEFSYNTISNNTFRNSQIDAIFFDSGILNMTGNIISNNTFYNVAKSSAVYPGAIRTLSQWNDFIINGNYFNIGNSNINYAIRFSNSVASGVVIQNNTTNLTGMADTPAEGERPNQIQTYV